MSTLVGTPTDRALDLQTRLPLPRRRPGVVIGSARPARRVALAQQLSVSGFEVWAAASGVDVLDTYLDHAGEVDVLLLDADLADLPAPAFYRRLRSHFPGVPCCFLADDPLSRGVTQAQALGASIFLWPLPFRRLVSYLQERVLTEE